MVVSNEVQWTFHQIWTEPDNMLGIVAALKELTVTERNGQGGEDKHKSTEF